MLKFTTSTFALACAISAATVANAEVEPGEAGEIGIVVTGTRAPDGQAAELSGSALTMIDAATLQSRQTRQIGDILRDVPGIAVNRIGGVGGQTQVRLRGAESNHTLVLIDGIEVSDPFLGEFDFASLIADDVARIEVLRGPQSAIYGSDAIGGVIHYITATGAEAPGVTARLEGGSFGTASNAARAGGVIGGLDYAFSGAFETTEGTPTARAGIGDRDLGAESVALSGKLGYAVSPNFRLKAVGRFSRTQAETNPQDFDFTSPTYGFVVDGDEDYVNRALYGLVRAELDLLDGRWTHAATAQINDTDRDSRTAGEDNFSTRGQRLKGSYETSLRFGTEALAHRLTLAADVEREQFRNVALFGPPTDANLRRQIDNIGLVTEYGVTIGDRIGLGGSIRRDDNDRFDDATTWRVHGSVALSEAIRVRGAAGSGIKNPTIFELFGFDPSSFIGNPNLKPEKSEGYELGADLTLAEGAFVLGVTWFDSTLKNEIFTAFSPTFVSTPDNRTTESKRRGVELAAAFRPGGGWRVDLAYTYLDAEENGTEEVRRAPHIASANLGWRAADDQLGATLTARYNGRQRDNNFTNLPLGPTVTLEDFALVNFAADYRLAPAVQLFGRVENLLDQDYEEVFTYRAPGRSARIGLRVGI